MGSFDGLHGGHLELLRRVKMVAKECGGESIVLTFEPHPRYVLGTGDGLYLLSTLEEKIHLLEQAGKKRGYLMSGGVVNTERMAKVLLDEYRSGKLGHFTFEVPEEEV